MTNNGWGRFVAYFHVAAPFSLTILLINLSNSSINVYCHSAALGLFNMQECELLALGWCSFSQCGSLCVAFSFLCNSCRYIECAKQRVNDDPITWLTRWKIVEAPLMLISGAGNIVTTHFTQECGQCFDYGLFMLHSRFILLVRRPKTVDAPLILIEGCWGIVYDNVAHNSG